MTKHSDLAADLLRKAAVFYRQIADSNPKVSETLEASAKTFEAVATLVENDPTGELQTDPVPARQASG